MFDRIAILISAICWLISHRRYSKIALVLFLWLFISDLAHTYLLLEFRWNNSWAIYQIYSLINSLVIISLIKLNSHMLPIYIMSLNILLNIAISFYFISHNIPVLVYNIYSYIAGGLVVSMLIYAGMLRNGARLKRCENPDSSTLNLLLFSRFRGNQRVHSRDLL